MMLWLCWMTEQRSTPGSWRNHPVTVELSAASVAEDLVLLRAFLCCSLDAAATLDGNVWDGVRQRRGLGWMEEFLKAFVCRFCTCCL